jgi:lipopolysaccharide transport system permease protein
MVSEPDDREECLPDPAPVAVRRADASTGQNVDPLGVFRCVWQHREVVWEMARRDVLGRYRGSVLGLLWSFCLPLLMLSIYTLVFGVVFQARWGAAMGNRAEFPIIFFAGLIVYTYFAECVTRAPTLVLAHATYVKKVLFPLEVLPWVVTASALFHAGVSFGVLLLVQSTLHGPPAWSAITLPLVLAPCVLFTMALSWVLASLGVYFRDTIQTVGLLTMAVLFLSPVFYPVSSLPEPLREWVWLNPLTFPIEQVRAVIFLGEAPRWGGLVMAWGAGLAAAWAGLLWFQKTRAGFADVL